MKDFYCVFVRTEMNLIAFSGPRNCVNTQYAALSGAMISVKFHSDIINSKRITGQKPFFLKGERAVTPLKMVGFCPLTIPYHSSPITICMQNLKKFCA